MRPLHALLRPSAADTGLVAAAPPVAARAIVRAFWPFVRPYRGRLALGLTALLVVPAIDAAEIYLFKLLVDDVLVPRELGALVPLAALYLGLAAASAVFGFVDDYLATWVGERFTLDVRARVFGHVHALSLAQLRTRRPGDLLQRVTSDVQAIERFILSALGEALQQGVRILLYAGALLVLSWKLALAAFVVLPAFLLLARAFGRLARHAAREKRRRGGALGAVAEESLALAPLVQVLHRRDAEVARFRAENEATMDAELAATRVRGIFGPLSDLVSLLGALIVLALGVWALQAGELTLGGLLVFLTYLTQLYGPVRSLGDLGADLFAAAAGAERVLELLAEVPEIADAPGARPLPRPVRGHVELCGVRVRHRGAAADVLRDVHLEVRPGELVALAGPSGAGKSSLAGLLPRLQDPAAGAVLLDGHDLRDVTLTSVRQAVSLLGQETLLPDVSVADALRQARPLATDRELEDAARAAQVLDVVTSLPGGWEARLGTGGCRLSGGERRRLAIARALLRDAPVLVLDEPTAGLDAAARDALLPALRTLVAGRTALVVTHDPEVLTWADRVVRVCDGGVREAAAPAPA
jgi:ABC-type multidrug transport system fused ATPase/permease subunit